MLTAVPHMNRLRCRPLATSAETRAVSDYRSLPHVSGGKGRVVFRGGGDRGEGGSRPVENHVSPSTALKTILGLAAWSPVIWLELSIENSEGIH